MTLSIAKDLIGILPGVRENGILGLHRLDQAELGIAAGIVGIGQLRRMQKSFEEWSKLEQLELIWLERATIVGESELVR